MSQVLGGPVDGGGKRTQGRTATSKIEFAWEMGNKVYDQKRGDSDVWAPPSDPPNVDEVPSPQRRLGPKKFGQRRLGPQLTDPKRNRL
jgi:hypothetical protein